MIDTRDKPMMWAQITFVFLAAVFWTLLISWLIYGWAT